MSESIESAPDTSDILKSAKIQYGGDKVFVMTRRMSGMPLLHRFEKSYAALEPDFKYKLNELLDKFPDPPSNQTNSTTNSQGAGNQQKSSSGWGGYSIRGIAEKFSMFNKNS